MIRLEMNRKQEAILAAIIIIAALAVFVLYSGIGRAPEPAPPPAPAEPPPPPPPHTFDIITEHIERYNNLDKTYDQWYENGEYTLKTPFVIRDPYGAAPLTALVRFETETPMMISISITGKTGNVSVNHTFDGYNTSHIIPIYGLYPGMLNIIEITARPRTVRNDTDVETNTLTIETVPMPDTFPANIILQHTDNDAAQHDLPLPDEEPPFYFSYVRNFAFDINGDYRWFYNGFNTSNHTKYMDDGIFHLIVGSFESEDATLLEINMLGKIISAVPIDETYDMHDYYGLYNIENRWLYPGR